MLVNIPAPWVAYGYGTHDSSLCHPFTPSPARALGELLDPHAIASGTGT